MSKKRRSKARAETEAERYDRWVRYVNSAYEDIASGFWNRKMFRAVQAMFRQNPELRAAEGALSAFGWIEDMYAHYIVMLVRRDCERGEALRR
jgi:hypothetical protein